ncbi:ATP-binding cassette subfamily B protein [Neobacillus bataviensis]|uniref:ATP-binding cassette subfamily B protein n=1 Tax=Neobacillus bataviensis TaxID=220685 RepID=A0A561DYY1_9BACI|nr:ABC transporter ATP-binding protein [Neobacillus bataviensis]TWE08578.1 ATP-binding cassette subfamily B protein [Neobacillus bataviensis]
MIRNEKEGNHPKMADRQLAKGMLSFAKPYWKLILFSILLTGFIVTASLAQPFILKIAIDSHINGLYNPMISTQQSKAHIVKELLKKDDISFKEIAILDHNVYFRLNPSDSPFQPISGTQKVAIVPIKNSYYLVHGWNKGFNQSKDYKVNSRNNEIKIIGHSYPITLLHSKEVNVFRTNDYQGLIYLGILYLLLIIGSALCTYFQNNSLQFTGQYVIYDFRKALFRHFSRLQMSFYRQNPIGRLVTRVTHDVESLNQLYSQVIVNLVKEVLILVGILILMLYMSVKLTLICFLVIPVIGIVTFYFKKVLRTTQRNLRTLLSRLLSFLAENLSGMSVIQLFAREEKQLQMFNELNERHYRAGMRQTIINSIFNPSIGLFGNISLSLLVWYGGGSVLDGGITFGTVYAFTHYVRQFFEPLRGLADRFNQIQAALASAERIFETLETKPTILNPVHGKTLPDKVHGNIVFHNVWFAYEKDDWVLKDIHFTIKKGETVGIVGATGAGKSSIIQLVNRFYDNQKGIITLDGINIKDVHLNDLRKHIGIIQQDPFVFSGSVYENIRLNHRHVSNEDIIKAAKSVNIDSFFRMLPEGYETMLGEEGTVLSAGQKQLLAFLRAMIADNDVLILDEATANIDTETEIAVQDTLKEMSKNRTTIIIAHRLSTIQHADKIIVLDKGRIVEMGNHQQLVRNQSAYYQLCVNQNKGTRVKEKV